MTLPAPVRAAGIVACLSVWLVAAGACGRAEAPSEDDAAPEPTEVAVQVGTIRRATLNAYITAYGRVEAEPAMEGTPPAQVTVTAALAGWIVEAPAVEGRAVRAGDLLFQLDSRLAETAIENARQSVEFAEKTVDRQHALAQAGGTSEKLVLESEQALAAARNELRSAETRRDLLRITAPISGVVTRVLVKVGQAVDPSMGLAELTDPDRIVVTAAVPSAEAGKLALDQPVEIGIAPDAVATTGRVTWIAPEVETVSDTVSVRVGLDSRAGLRPGQFVRVRVVSEQHADCLTVPVESVVRTADSNVIAVLDGDTAAQRAVRVGIRDGGLVEVAGDGLREGMRVVTEGAYGLPERTKVLVLDPP